MFFQGQCRLMGVILDFGATEEVFGQFAAFRESCASCFESSFIALYTEHTKSSIYIQLQKNPVSKNIVHFGNRTEKKFHQTEAFFVEGSQKYPSQLVATWVGLQYLMKISIIIVLLLAATSLAKDPVQVTVYASKQDPEDHDYVEIVAKIGETDASLPRALSNLAKKAVAVVDTALVFCGDKEKKKCQESIEVGNPQIESRYQLLRKVETFMNFIVEHQIVIKVYKTDQIGLLVDNLQRIGIKKFESFTWKALKEVPEEATVVLSATERVTTLCDSIGQKVDRVVSIEHYVPEEQDQEKGEQEEADDEEEEQEGDQVYKLVFECVEKKGGAAAK